MANNLIDEDFKMWVSSISKSFKQAQIKVAIRVNNEMLEFYYKLGKEIENNIFKAHYGSSFYDSLSVALSSNLPNVKGFSPRNLRYIEKFYSLYHSEIEKVPQLVAELFQLPWGHHRYIIDKCKDVNKALFFVKKSVNNSWSKGISSYELNRLLPKELKKSLPSIEELESKLSD